MNCPNCGSVDRCEVMFIDSGTPGDVDKGYHCDDCGAIEWEGDCQLSVPTRSRPPEVLELPDAEGWWWPMHDYLPEAEAVHPYHIKCIRGRPYYDCTGSVVGYGKWVRAIPPIIPPAKEPAAISDADVMRFLVGCYHMSGSSSHIEGPRPTNQDVEWLVARVSQPADVKPEATVEDIKSLRDVATLLAMSGAWSSQVHELRRIASSLGSQAKEQMQPPIVPPAKVEPDADVDDEWIRTVNSCLVKAAQTKEVEHLIRAIAVLAERLKRDAKEMK